MPVKRKRNDNLIPISRLRLCDKSCGPETKLQPSSLKRKLVMKDIKSLMVKYPQRDQENFIIRTKCTGSFTFTFYYYLCIEIM